MGTIDCGVAYDCSMVLRCSLPLSRDITLQILATTSKKLQFEINLTTTEKRSMVWLKFFFHMVFIVTKGNLFFNYLIIYQSKL